jgi:hypothetical protein
MVLQYPNYLVEKSGPLYMLIELCKPTVNGFRGFIYPTEILIVNLDIECVACVWQQAE